MKGPQLKSQPTSYKDFLQQISKNKQNKSSTQTYSKHKQTPKNSSITTPHSQSTSIWQKPSSQARIHTETDISAQKHEKYCKSHNHSVQIEPKQIKTSRKDNLLCYHKFITSTTSMLSSLLNLPTPQLLTTRISYLHFLESLKCLKMITPSYEPYPNDLVSQLWSECISNQNVGNFIITVAAILGLYQQGEISEEEKYLKAKYQKLMWVRMEQGGGGAREQSNGNGRDWQCTFQPAISERSRKIIAQRESGEKDRYREDRCSRDEKNKDKSKSKRKILQKVSSERVLTEWDRNVTHRISKNDENQDSENFCMKFMEPLKIDKTGNKRSNILYEQARQKSHEKTNNKSRNDIQYEKSINQLTFKPKILKLKNKQKVNNTKCAIKGQKNTISRMIRGRVQRQVRKIINQKGMPYNEKLADKMRRQKYEQITTTTNFDSIPESLESTLSINTNQNLTNANKKPIKYQFQPQKPQNINLAIPSKSPAPPVPDQDLIIDVYISQDRKQKLLLRKGQSLQIVASQFIQQHGLSSQKRQQLIQLLQVSITHALCPIDQLVEQQDELASARTRRDGNGRM